MGAPTEYERQYSFQGFQQLNPTSPLPAERVDAELNAVKVALDDTQDNLALIQRGDGALQNRVVHLETLGEDVSLGFRRPTAWAGGVAYAQYDTVFSGPKLYQSNLAHTSGDDFATDLSASKWTLLADFSLGTIIGSVQETAFTLTGGQTSISVSYSGVIEVYLNGVKLIDGTDFTAINGTSVVLTEAASAGDIAVVRVFDTFDVSGTYSQSQSDARYAKLSGAAFVGTVSFAAEIVVAGGVSFTGTSATQLHSGTTAQRPLVPIAGMTRYNTTLAGFEFYFGGSWQQYVPVTGGTVTGTLNVNGADVNPTGTVLDYLGTSAPTGYVFGSGRSIGNASSGATERANADTAGLFTLIWNSMNVSGGAGQIQDSAGVNTTRGVSAAADFAANKRILLPDLRGRVTAGKDDMGGTAASRLSLAQSQGVDGLVLGGAGGEQGHQITTAELATHTHTATVTDPGHTHTVSNVWAGPGGGSGIGGSGQNLTSPTTSSATTGISVSNANAGSNTAHNNVQPTFVVNKIIKL